MVGDRGPIHTSAPAELTTRDIQLLTRCVLGLVAPAEKITYECLNDAPPSNSVAHRMFKSDASSYAMEAFLVMQYANLSGFDHARAFVALIRTPTVRSTALATVSRGALESFARSWYLLSRDDDLDIVHRVISLLRSDLRYPARFGEELKTRDGVRVDPATKREFYLLELQRLQLPAPAQIELAQMVARMLDAALDDYGGHLRYSALSAIAHAHRLGINTFVTTDDAGGVSGLVAPREVVIELASQVMAALGETMERFVELFGNQPRHRDLIDTAFERGARTIVAMTEG